MDKLKVLVEAEEYKKECDLCELEPVDLNKGYVPMDKYAKDNTEKTQESIKRRFDLDSEGGEQ